MSVVNLSEYLTVGMIAKGQNTVLRMKSIYTQKEYALKKIRRADFDKHLIDLQELLHLMNCSHPNIIKIFGFTIYQQKLDSYRNEYILCILMDIMDKTLEKDIKERSATQKFYSKDELFKITRDLISALVYMQNEIKLAHRDIKPENILFDQEGTLLLSDFSESFLENEIKKSSTTLVGSPYYMAPEIREIFTQGEFGERPEYNPWKADVYSTGITVLDCALLSIGVNKPKKEKLEIVESQYGKEFRELIELCLIDEVEKRPDFSRLVKCEEYTNAFGNFEMDFVLKKKENTGKTENSSLAYEFLELIDSLKDEIKEENLNHEEVLSIFKDIQLLEQEKNALAEKNSIGEVNNQINEEVPNNANKNCPQPNFNEQDSLPSSGNKKEKSEVSFQNGNTQ